MKRKSNTTPHILLVEDDPISQTFLRTALTELPARVDCVGSISAALQAADDAQYDLFLIDMTLPDGHGDVLLMQLRARHPVPPALAHTADDTLETRRRLLEAGFQDVFLKPISGNELLAATRLALGMATADDAVQWDDKIACAALNGNSANVLALRKLFLDELPSARNSVTAAIRNRDVSALRNSLHRLQASCGFVGASRLASTVTGLRTAPTSAVALEQFRAAIDALLELRN
ncbi:MAG: response regulator [Xanthomonadaceae bacterium]|jgi:DNA-binding response OmpR family regulator|nr:response regulator [Xanthomonadaceae bacterium]